jgi:predicted ATPase/DNA-binding CsgD family transcriptional regulator
MYDRQGQQAEVPSVLKHEPLWNVPARLTPLIGREHELIESCALLANPEVRLLTLLGPGGIGKTRLSIEIAARLRSSFADGVCFVALASISDAALVLPTLAQEAGIQEAEIQPSLDLVKAHLRERQMLLLLDNFEQVVAAAPQLWDLLVACPGIKLLVTSRAPLHLQGEQEFPVPPLALPPLNRLPDSEALTHYAAVALFLQRARALMPDFQITQANARAIAEICVKLDGLPLAVELAASRIKLLPPPALLARLSRRLQVLTGGSPALPMRQQTLRYTLKWSYDLLSAQEQQLFRRISVFAGSCTLQALESIYTTLGDEAEGVLDRVASLIDKSLLQRVEMQTNEAEPRLTMLETVHEYGLECLNASEEEQAVRSAHAHYYLELAEEAEPALEGPQQAHWMELLEQEHDNLRAALLWSLTQAEHEQATHSDIAARELALRLGGALRRFWVVRGYFSEGQDALARALAASEGCESIGATIRAKALLTHGVLSSMQGDYKQAAIFCTASLDLFRQLHDPRSIATVLYQLGRFAWMRGDFTQARAFGEEALLYSRESGHKGSIAWSLFRLARLLIEQGEYDRGRALLEENLALQKETGNKRGIAATLYHLAWTLFATQGDPLMVGTRLATALTLFQEVGDREGFAYSLYLAGRLAFCQNDLTSANSQLQASVSLFREMRHQEGTALALSLLGRVTAAQGDFAAAYVLHEESLKTARELDRRDLLAFCLEELAAWQVSRSLAQTQDAQDKSGTPPVDILWAARLWGAAQAQRDTTSMPMLPIDHAYYEELILRARRQWGDSPFATAWSEGRTMSLEQALAAQGRGNAPPAGVPAITPEVQIAISPAGLTAREIEVLRLLAQGLTSAQIAERLVLSPLTVNSHVRSIYSKLGVTSRSGATRYALEHKLV